MRAPPDQPNRTHITSVRVHTSAEASTRSERQIAVAVSRRVASLCGARRVRGTGDANRRPGVRSRHVRASRACASGHPCRWRDRGRRVRWDDAESGSGDGARPANGFPEWPAPDDPIERTTEAGLTPEVKEQLQTHRHSHLDVFVDGEAVPVPAGIGIDITDPGVQHFPDGGYGGIEECTNPCISPLHTHDETGIIHTEAAADTLLTLGQLFTEWGVKLDDECVGEFCESETDIAVYIGGDEYEGDPADIELDDQLVIAIVIGTPPERIPARADFSQG